MSPIKNVTGTAFVVAEFRARENDKAHPLYVDKVVPIFLDRRTRQAADAISADFAPAEINVRLRTRYLDDRLDRQLADGCRQVVILGAGLDTRAERKRSDGVAYFEIDDASTLDFKRRRLAERGMEAPVAFIAGNYVASGALPLLEANGFDRDLPSFFIWEGNTMYLSEADAKRVLRDLKACVRALSIAFDYMDTCGSGEDDRRGGNYDLRGTLRRHGRALALRHRRCRSARRGDRLDRRRRHDRRRSAPEILARSALGIDRLRALQSLHADIVTAREGICRQGPRPTTLGVAATAAPS